jgi:hypothetical protein
VIVIDPLVVLVPFAGEAEKDLRHSNELVRDDLKK